MNEYLLAVDNYNKPSKITGKKAEYYVILKLLLMNKGENPLFPDMGVGLVQKYRYCTEDDIPDLEQDINDQMTTYLPLLLIDRVTVSLEDGNLVLSISSSETETNYNYSSEDHFGLDAIEDNDNDI